MYPTNLTDSQWQVIQELLADKRKRKHDLRKVFNALFYVVKGGIPWRQMPTDLPPWKTVYYRAGGPVFSKIPAIRHLAGAERCITRENSC